MHYHYNVLSPTPYEGTLHSSEVKMTMTLLAVWQAAYGMAGE